MTRRSLALTLLTLAGTLVGAGGVSALIFYVDQILPATLMP